MNRIEEIMVEIDGKISYADSTGNCSDKEELIEAKKVLETLNISREFKDSEICDTCKRGNYFECGCKPNTIIDSRVIKCNSFRGENAKI